MVLSEWLDEESSQPFNVKRCSQKLEAFHALATIN